MDDSLTSRSREPTTDTPAARARLLRDSPPAFKKRNVFTDAVDLPLRLGAGRPPKTAEEKRQANAARQRRFRTRRALEYELLQHALRQLWRSRRKVDRVLVARLAAAPAAIEETRSNAKKK